MAFKHTLAAGAGLALAANAFMIPSTMSMPEAKDGMDALQALDPRLVEQQYPGQIVKLQCPECYLPEGIDVDMSLILNFTVTDDGKVLSLNGDPFLTEDAEPAERYSFLQMPTGLPDFLTSFMSSHGQVNYQHGPDTESHVLEPLELNTRTRTRQISATDDTDAQLFDIDFRIFDDAAGQPSAIDSVTLRVIQDEQKTFSILEIVRVPADGSAPDEDGPNKSDNEEEQMFEILPITPIRPSSPNGEPELEEVPTLRHKPEIVDCHGMPLSVCRFQHIMKEKILAMHNAITAAMSGRPSKSHGRPCSKGMHGPPGLNLHGGVNKFTNPDGTPKVHPGHGPHSHDQHQYHHGPMYRAIHFMRRFFFGFIVPVMIGVAAGMTASLAGMVVGTGLAMLWIRIRRGGKRGQQNSVRLEQGEAHESEGFMKAEEAEAEPRDSEETLPAYEEKHNQTDNQTDH